MGYTQHRFLIVHSWDATAISDARGIAIGVFGESLVGPVMHTAVNCESGFTVWTSGSKTGWPEDDGHLAKIRDLIELLSKMERPPRWVRVDDGEEIGDLFVEHGKDGDYEHRYKRASACSLFEEGGEVSLSPPGDF